MEESSKDPLKVLRDIKKWIDKRAVRELIRASIKDYSEEKIYVLYNDKVEEYNEDWIELNKQFGHVKKYYLSKPFKVYNEDNRYKLFRL